MAPDRLRHLRSLCLLLLAAVPATLIGMQNPSPLQRGVRVVDVLAAVPEAGGFQPDSVAVSAGQKVRLRFRAADVTHGVAVGPGLGIDLGDLAPGEVKAVDVTFPEAGVYTFYCNKWCSPNHWRMRGVIEVQGDRGPAPAPHRDPVIDNLLSEGIDIDAYLSAHTGDNEAAHGTHVLVAPPTEAYTPDAAAGASQISGLTVPPDLGQEEWRRRHTPLEGETLLAHANPAAARSVIADVVAYLWLSETDPAALEAVGELYAKNCAACHGEDGSGDGFAAASNSVAPPSFADTQRMATRRSDVLYAKIRRGGMGTGMPNFGTLFTPQETRLLVDYIWLLGLGR